MAIAFVLINCVLGTESEVIQNLKLIDSIKEAHPIFGSYDIIVKIESDEKNNLQDIIHDIRKMDDVTSTSTLIIPK
ncbi:Lrp/AsnC ligand binding domain-containing protein [Nitrosopumilus sp. S6]